MDNRAMRWFTMPLTWGALDDDHGLDQLCLAGRWRVRRQLELPQDRLDLVIAAQQAAHDIEAG